MPGYPLAPAEKNPQFLNNAIQQLMQGRVNCTGTFTCATGAATTVVMAPTAGVGTGILYGALTPEAGAEIASGNFSIPLVTVAGQFTVNHTNSATANRSFFWANFG